ncbi:MAG: ABC transporter permease [Acidimicrobiia bacterium]
MSTLSVKRRRDFRQRRWQFLAVGLTIALGVMMFAASYSAYLNLESSYNGTYDRLAFADMTVTGAEENLAATAAGLEGVASVEERRQADLPFRVVDGILGGRAIGMPPDSQPTINQIDVTEGTYLDSERPDGVVVETHMADDFELSVGETIEVFAGTDFVEVEVIGIAVSAEYLWPARSRQEIFTAPGTFGVIFVSEELLKPFPANAVAEQTLVLYGADADTEATDQRVSDAARAAGATDVETQADQPSNAVLQLDVDGFQQLAIAFPVLFLVAAGMAAFILLTRIVYAQRAQIGTLRASGVTRRSLSRHYLSYGIILGIIGAVAGTVLGASIGFALTGVYTAELGIPDTVREVHLITVVGGLAFGLITGLVSAWLPARAAFRTSPAEAMRGEVPLPDGRPSLFEHLLPPLRRAPVRWRMVLRGVGRDKRRSLSTVIGVVLALVLILASWGMIDTVVVLMDRQFNEVNLEDASAVFTTPITEDQVAVVQDATGVEIAEDVASLSVSIRANGGAYATELRAFRQGTQLHGFLSASGGLPNSGIVGGVALGDVLGVLPGDPVELSFSTLETSLETTLVEFVDEPMGTLVYMERTALEDALSEADPGIPAEVLMEPLISTVGTVFVDGADRGTVISSIEDIQTTAAVIDKRAFYNLAQDFLGFFYVFVGVMLLFGGLMAFALIFNTISVNVAERSTEYATMRANGLSQRKIAALMTGENMLLTAIGIIPGLIVGSAIAALFMSYYSSDMFQFNLEMSWTTLALSSLFMLIVAGFSLWPGIRTVRRLDIGAVVRERAL